MIRLFTFLIVLFSSSLYAATYFNASDVVGNSARMIGMGNVEGWDRSSTGVFENPASLYSISRWSAASFYTSFFADEVKLLNVSIATRTPIGVIAVGQMQTKVTDIPYTQQTNLQEYYVADTFAYLHSITKLGYAISAGENLHLGINASYSYTQLYNVLGKGLNADAGILWTAKPVEITLTAKNILWFQNEKYTDPNTGEVRKEELPLQLIAGAKTRLSDVELMGQVKKTGSFWLKSVGVAYAPSAFSKALYFSGGLKEDAILDKTRWSYGVGVGLELGSVNFHYAYSPSQVFDQPQQHYFSLALNF